MQKENKPNELPHEVWLAMEVEERPPHAEPLDIVGDISFVDSDNHNRLQRIVVAHAAEGDVEANMRHIVAMWNSSKTLHSTFQIPHGDGCCGCINLIWVPDEQAYMAKCNECGKVFGWAKTDWSNVKDRVRLGSEPNGITNLELPDA